MADSSPQHSRQVLEEPSLGSEMTYIEIVHLRDDEICKSRLFVIFIA